MNVNDYWNNFCKSGSIKSYLEYATFRDKAGKGIGTDEKPGIDTQDSQSQ
ncbi:MAG: hypothetical protein IJ460_08815 [Clostridia bacterium]|nr:hypothetical protein [Clostridia bacterium]